MKPVVPRLYAVLVALSLVGLACWSGADWYQRQQSALEQGRSALRQTAGLLTDLTVHHLPLDAPTLAAVFSKPAPADPRWKMLLLSSQTAGTEFYRGPRPAVPVAQAVPRWAPKALTEVKVAIPVFLAGREPLVLEGIYEFYGRSEVFALFRAATFTLFALLVLSTALIVVIARARDPEPRPGQGTLDPEPSDAGVPDEFPIPDLEFNLAEDEVSFAPPSSDDTRTEGDEYWFDDELTLEDLPPLEDRPPVESAPQAPSTPASLLGPADRFLPSLEDALARAAGLGQDLVVLDLALAPATDAETRDRLVAGAFGPEAQTFASDAGALVLWPGRSLEDGLAAARTLCERADEDPSAGSWRVGAAARSGRMVAASVLAAEASSARRRTQAGALRVLGLKTDPKRYQDYLDSRTA